MIMNRKRRKITQWMCIPVMSAMIFCAGIPSAGLPVSDAAVSTDKPVEFVAAANYGSKLTDSFKSVAKTKDGGYIAAGYSFAVSENPSWGHLSKSNNDDGILVKFDRDLNIEWAKNFGGNGNYIILSVDVLTDGTIVAAGRASAFLPEGNDKSTVCGYILKVDPTDPEKYEEFFVGGSKGDYLEGVTATADGGFAVAGYSSSTDAAIWGDHKVSSAFDGLIVKYDATGAVQFAACHNLGRDLGIASEDLKRSRFFGLDEDPDGNLIAVGDLQVTGHIYNSQIVKFDGKSGKALWGKTAGSSLVEAPTENADYHTSSYAGVEALDDGSFVAVGTTKNDATTEENWEQIGEIDGTLVRYSADGAVMHSENIGTIDGQVDLVGAMQDPDGGYFVYGSAGNQLIEKSQREKGYTWKNRGAHDMLLIRYGEDNKAVWSQTYGTIQGDYVNDMLVTDDNEILVIGESNGTDGTDGTPAWKNNGNYDAIVLCTKDFEGAVKEIEKKDGNVTWADGEYTDSANGYQPNLTVKVTISGNRIASVEPVSNNETAGIYDKAIGLYQKIAEEQSADLDAASGATLSSNGIMTAAKRCLSQAAAKDVMQKIAAIGTPVTADSAEAITTARASCQELGTYALSLVENLDALTAAEQAYTALTGKTLPGSGENGAGTNTPDSQNPDVQDSEDDSVNPSSNDTYARWQDAYLENIHTSYFRDKNLTGKGVRIAVIDSGVTPSHQDLDYSHILPGYNFADDSENTSDTSGHGTGVIGILQAVAENETGIAGLLSEADIIPLKVSGSKKAETFAKEQAAAIRAAVDTYQAQVITMSEGVYLGDEDAEAMALMKEAVDYAASRNVLMIAAAGNQGKKDGVASNDYMYPAAYEPVIGVGAVDQKNVVRANSQRNDSVFVVAPGENIFMPTISRKTQCTISSGTSFSAPIVASMAVVGKSVLPDLTLDQFKQFLIDTSADGGETGYDVDYGNGIVDFRAFANALLNAAGRHAEVCPGREFSDVDVEKGWYHEAVDYVLDHGMMKGKGDGIFAPQEELTRAQMVQILYNREAPDLADPQKEGEDSTTFQDVSESAWYADAVAWAAENNIVKGTGDGMFEPEEKVQRQQVTTMMRRYAEWKAFDLSAAGDLQVFEDQDDIADWAWEGMIWAVGTELINGMGDGTVKPKAETTRAQIAKIMMQFCENVAAE